MAIKPQKHQPQEELQEQIKNNVEDVSILKRKTIKELTTRADPLKL